MQSAIPKYDYICLTLAGEYLSGELDAPNKNALALDLWSHKLFLVYWHEHGVVFNRGSVRSLPASLELTRHIARLEASARGEVPEDAEPLPAVPSLPLEKKALTFEDRVLFWMAVKTGGAVRTRAPALLVASLLAIGLLATGVNIVYSLIPRRPKTLQATSIAIEQRIAQRKEFLRVHASTGTDPEDLSRDPAWFDKSGRPMMPVESQ